MKTMLSKLTSVLLCLAMLLTMCSFAMAEAGTYTGVGDSEIGGKGAIEVSVTVDENGVVTDIQVTKNGDTAGIADAAVEAMPGRIMAAQSANVDGVSGATMTSEAIKMAVLDAVTAAGLDTVKWSTYAATEAAKADDATYNTDIVIIGRRWHDRGADGGGKGRGRHHSGKSGGCRRQLCPRDGRHERGGYSRAG